MKAIVCEKPFSLGVGELPKPSRAAGEVLIRISRIGLCGTDYHIFSGNQPFLSYPRVMGHELAGVVAEADDDAAVAVGELVTINPYLNCGVCIACRQGKPNCCTHIRVLGVHTDGGMTEFVCVPASAAIPVTGLTPDQAAMVEFLSIGAHAVRRGDTRTGNRALVVGAGPIGVAVALFAGLAGAEVTLIDTQEERLAYARDKVGIANTCKVGEALDGYLRARSDNEFFDIVFDCTGNGKAIEAGFAYVAHGGRYVLVSVVKDVISFADPEFHKREMQLIGSRNATRDDFDVPKVIPQLIERQGSVLKAIVTV
ncbi:MAG: zinc-binding alcohol dehydrogenase family protein [Asticcacaulis sp.]|nr:zinc-binding alcohol dehydrogenase family protein [Asticcacaulis sp.]